MQNSWEQHDFNIRFHMFLFAFRLKTENQVYWLLLAKIESLLETVALNHINFIELVWTCSCWHMPKKNCSLARTPLMSMSIAQEIFGFCFI